MTISDVKLFCKEDCGNAPGKKMFLDWLMALAKGDFAFVAGYVADEAVWERVGSGKISGKDNLIEALKNRTGQPITGLRIDHVITHGRTAALHGMTACGGKRRRFCDVYEFDSTARHAKIKEWITYAIEEDDEPSAAPVDPNPPKRVSPFF